MRSTLVFTEPDGFGFYHVTRVYQCRHQAQTQEITLPIQPVVELPDNMGDALPVVLVFGSIASCGEMGLVEGTLPPAVPRAVRPEDVKALPFTVELGLSVPEGRGEPVCPVDGVEPGVASARPRIFPIPFVSVVPLVESSADGV